MLFPCVIAHNLQDKSFPQKFCRKPRRRAHAYRVLGENNIRALARFKHEKKINEMAQDLRQRTDFAKRNDPQIIFLGRQVFFKKTHIRCGTPNLWGIHAGRDCYPTPPDCLTRVIVCPFKNVAIIHKKTYPRDTAEDEDLREEIPDAEEFNRDIQKSRVQDKHDDGKHKILRHLPWSGVYACILECPELLERKTDREGNNKRNDC